MLHLRASHRGSLRSTGRRNSKWPLARTIAPTPGQRHGRADAPHPPRPQLFETANGYDRSSRRCRRLRRISSHRQEYRRQGAQLRNSFHEEEVRRQLMLAAERCVMPRTMRRAQSVRQPPLTHRVRRKTPCRRRTILPPAPRRWRSECATSRTSSPVIPTRPSSSLSALPTWPWPYANGVFAAPHWPARSDLRLLQREPRTVRRDRLRASAPRRLPHRTPSRP